MPKLKDGYLINIFELKDALNYTMKKLDKYDPTGVEEYNRGFRNGVEGIICTLDSIIEKDKLA